MSANRWRFPPMGSTFLSVGIRLDIDTGENPRRQR